MVTAASGHFDSRATQGCAAPKGGARHSHHQLIIYSGHQSLNIYALAANYSVLQGTAHIISIIRA